MKINKSVFNFNFTYSITYDNIYRSVHRIKITAREWNIEGEVKFMISRRYKNISLHLYAGDIYIKYPKPIKNHKQLNRVINKMFVNSYKDVFKPFRETRVPLGIFYLILDKVAVECKLNRKKITIMMSWVMQQKTFTKYSLFKVLSLLLKNVNHITKEVEPIINNMSKYINNYPTYISYIPVFDLINFKFSNVTQPRIPRLSYEEFLETLEGFTDEELLELLGNYKILKEAEYYKDIKQMLYRETQKFK